MAVTPRPASAEAGGEGGQDKPPLAAIPEAGRLRFDVFELDLRTHELRKAGQIVHLQHQPFRVLALLAAQPFHLFTRQEIQRQIWRDDTYVDFEQGLNFCIRQVRAALGDDAESPRFVETLPRRGYRFIAPVERINMTPEIPHATARPWKAVTAAVAALIVAAAVVVAVRRSVSPPAGSRGRVMLAVLPFTNPGLGSEPDYLADGLTEAMIAQLGRLQPRALGVIARASAMRFRGPNRDLDAIARDLGVGYVVEGSVRRGADRVRITVELIQVTDRTQLWAETYERELKDILAVQSEVAQAVARRIQLTLTPQEEARLANTRPVDPEAYQLYLRGRFFWNKRDEDGLRRSIGYFEQAIARQPDYVLAHVGLADAYIVLADQSALPASEAWPRAKAAAGRALELDEASAEAQTSLGMIAAVFEWDWAEAERRFHRALELNPNYATAHHWYAHYLRSLGRQGEAVEETRRALDLDPLSLIINNNVASALFYAGRYEEATAQYQRTVEMDPRWGPAHWGIGRTHLRVGRTSEALASLERAAASSTDPGYHATLAYALAVSGREDDARRVMRDLVALSRHRYVSAYDLAVVHAGLGERHEALSRLEEAFRGRHGLMRLIAVDERLESLRGEPRFKAIVRAMGLPTGVAR